MSITISGSSGIVGANGSVTFPALTGADIDTGIFFPAANVVAFSVGGTEVMRSNTNGTFVTSMNVATLNVTTLNVTSMNVTSISSPSLTSVSGGNTGDIVISLTTSKTGYLACDGSLYTRSSYYPLANAIGTPYSFSIITANTLTGTNSGLIHEANGVLYRTGKTLTPNATVPQAGGLMISTDGISWNFVTGLPVLSPGGSAYGGGYGNMAAYGNNFTVLQGAGWANNSTTVYYQYGTGSNTTGPFVGGSYSPSGYNAYYPLITEIAYGGTSNRFVTSTSGFSQVGCTFTNSYWHLYYMGNPSTPVLGTSITYPSTNFSVQYPGVAASPTEFIATTYLTGGTSAGSTNIVLRSLDGATWGNVTANVVSALANSSDIITSVSYSQHTSKYYLTTVSGQILQSSNGANYTWSSVATNSIARNKIRTAYASNGGTLYYYSTDTLAGISTSASGTTIFSTDLINWTRIPNSALAPAMGTFLSVAQPNNSTRIYGGTISSGTLWGVSRANSASYYADLFNYNTTTQFPVPYISSVTGSTSSNNSPTGYNSIPVNYFIKT